MPDSDNRRVLVDAPSRYIELDEEPGNNPVRLTAFTFAYHYPSGPAVKRDQLALPGVVIATVQWATPGFVIKRIDGSWLNHYSRYRVPGSSQYELSTATGGDGIDTSILFYSIPAEVMIECQRIFKEPLRSCILTKQVKPHVGIEIAFDASLLPYWRKLIAKTASLVTIHEVGSTNAIGMQRS